MPARDGYDRVVIWLSNQGHVVDLGGHRSVGSGTPEQTETRFNLAAGDSRARQRTNRFEISTIDDGVRAFLRLMRHMGCKARLVAFSPGGAHEFWYQEARIQFIDRRSGDLAFAGGTVILENRIFNPGIWQSDNLLEGVPWYGAVATSDGVTFYLESPTLNAYEGPKWVGSSGDSVNFEGLATIATSFVLTIEFPCEDAWIRLSDAGATVFGTLEAQDWNGVTIGTVAQGIAFKVPRKTWHLVITITAASTQPRLEVIRSGAIRDPRFGDFETDCATRVASPYWFEAADEVGLGFFQTAQAFYAPTYAAGENQFEAMPDYLIVSSNGGSDIAARIDVIPVTGGVFGAAQNIVSGRGQIGRIYVDYVNDWIYFAQREAANDTVKVSRIRPNGTAEEDLFNTGEGAAASHGCHLDYDQDAGTFLIRTSNNKTIEINDDGTGKRTVDTASAQTWDICYARNGSNYFRGSSTFFIRGILATGGISESISGRGAGFAVHGSHVIHDSNSGSGSVPIRKREIAALTNVSDIASANKTSGTAHGVYVAGDWAYFKKGNADVSRVHVTDLTEEVVGTGSGASITFLAPYWGTLLFP